MALMGESWGRVSGRRPVDSAVRRRGRWANAVLLVVVLILAVIMAVTSGGARSRPRVKSSGTAVRGVLVVGATHGQDHFGGLARPL
jgi:hypothetical protein